jgi:hypothetical protein
MAVARALDVDTPKSPGHISEEKDFNRSAVLRCIQVAEDGFIHEAISVTGSDSRRARGVVDCDCEAVASAAAEFFEPRVRELRGKRHAVWERTPFNNEFDPLNRANPAVRHRQYRSERSDELHRLAAKENPRARPIKSRTEPHQIESRHHAHLPRYELTLSVSVNLAFRRHARRAIQHHLENLLA